MLAVGCGEDDEAGGGDTTVTVDTSATVDTDELEEEVEEAIETGEEALEEALTRDLEEQNDSGVSGTVTLEPVSEEEVRVRIELTGGEGGASHPAHIHAGTCDDLDPNPAYPLDNVEDGRSETTVDASPPRALHRRVRRQRPRVGGERRPLRRMRRHPLGRRLTRGAPA